MLRYAVGEDGVFEELYRLLEPRVARFCARLVERRSDVPDLIQETFMRLHRSRATFMDGSNPVHWVRAIARSAHLDKVRYRRRRPEHLGPARDAADDDPRAPESHDPEMALRARDVEHVVRVELQKMSEKNRVAYILLREEGMSVKEAAALLGSTAAVVKKRAHRAYTQLRAALSAAGWNHYHREESWDTVPVPA